MQPHSKDMKSILTLAWLTWASTSLFAQNSSLTLYITSTIADPTELTVAAVQLNSSDTTIVDVVWVTDTQEITVVHSYPDSAAGAMILLSYSCDGVDMNVPVGFAFGSNTPGGEPVEGEIAVEIGCQDMDCEWHLDVDMSNDMTDPITFNVVIPSGEFGIWEWYVDGELVGPNTFGGGLIWEEPYESICATMYSLGDCPVPSTQCYEGGGGGMDCLDGLDVGALIAYLTTNCSDQTNPDFWMYCDLMESLTAAMTGDEDACEELWSWLDAGGWEGETGCDINFEVMQAWEANGELIPDEVWVWIYDYDSDYTYTCDFGDESPVTTEPNPSHTYSGDGPYTFCITVSSEADSCSTTYCETLSVDSLGMLGGFMNGFTVNVMGAGEVVTCVDESLIDPSVFCPEIYEPVCGCDGVTYGNSCWATYSAGLTSWEDGPCSVDNVEHVKWTENFEVHPNPTMDGQLQVRGLDFRQGEFTSELVSLTGVRVNVDMNSVNSTNGECTLHLGDFTPGIYLLRIEQQGILATRKVIIH